MQDFKTDESDAINERCFEFINDWMLYPILGSKGDYPESMKKRIASESKRQGFKKSRLPSFTEEEKSEVKGSMDFMGFNYYTFVRVMELNDSYKNPSYFTDIGGDILPEPGELYIKVLGGE